MNALQAVLALAAAQEAEDVDGFRLLLAELTDDELRTALSISVVYARIGMRHIHSTDDLRDVLGWHLLAAANADPDGSPPAL